MQNKGTKAKRKILTGLVKSDKMDKTLVVQVMRTTKHAKYKKIIKRYSSFKAHDEKNVAKIGDMVRMAECRPISKHKRWRLIEVLK
ncbi:MAG: 30S ribosomal protein S17 [Candidatus Omnitrophica bacterium]|nr:30S ribosomal protein S17 [Candidatus Omnitrophota bacterium]